jgi:hypothetical protein
MNKKTEPACRFCGQPALGRFTMSAGCVCKPDDREQDLCLHHTMRANPLGSMQLIADYTTDGAFRTWWDAGMPHPNQEKNR